MRALITAAAMIALTGCSSFGHPEDPPANTGPHPTVLMKYKGPGGFDIAARKANDYCRKHYGGASAHLLADDMKGKARFECVD